MIWLGLFGTALDALTFFFLALAGLERIPDFLLVLDAGIDGALESRAW